MEFNLKLLQWEVFKKYFRVCTFTQRRKVITDKSLCKTGSLSVQLDKITKNVQIVRNTFLGRWYYHIFGSTRYLVIANIGTELVLLNNVRSQHFEIQCLYPQGTTLVDRLM